MIELGRPHGRVLRIGHRGAAALAPENTLRSFRAAVAAGVDLIEFDVLDLLRGPLVLAHSDHLDEVSHGAANGRVRRLSLEELREVAPELPTLDEALAFFVDEAPHVGLHVDLKLRHRLDELGAAIRRHGLESRTVVSGVHVPSLKALAAAAPRVTVGITYPEDKLSISRKPYLWPIVSLGLTSMRASVPLRLPRLARRAGASAVMLQHRLVTESSVRRAHDGGPARARLDGRRAGRSPTRRGGRRGRGDHERSADLRGYTDAVNRGVTIAALSACGAAGVIAAVLLATAPGAGADDGTTTGTTTDDLSRDDGHDHDGHDHDDASDHDEARARRAEGDRGRRHDRPHARRRPDGGRGARRSYEPGSHDRSRSSAARAPGSS